MGNVTFRSHYSSSLRSFLHAVVTVKVIGQRSMPQTSVDNSHFILLPFGIHCALFFLSRFNKTLVQQNKLDILCSILPFSPLFPLELQHQFGARYFLCTENHVCDMTASQTRLDFPNTSYLIAISMSRRDLPLLLHNWTVNIAPAAETLVESEDNTEQIDE